jgi:Ca2+-binding EF-hand superfamily protein
MSKPMSGSASETMLPKRVFFLNRTSDIVGSFTKTDLDSYSDLIRRKVQERCQTTQDLMTTIRRIKTGEAGYVTPNEFRFTLIKLGITLPQKVVNDLFNRFDSDGSGTMDFDEFAMWIMNSEFRPQEPDTSPPAKREPPNMALRTKFSQLFKEHPAYSSGTKTQYTFLELVSEITRQRIASISERDVRSMFLLMDRRKTNSIDMRAVKRWAETGVAEAPPASAKAVEVPELRMALVKVCGKTPELIVKGFEYARGLKNVHFEEFRRSLLACGLGQRQEDVKNLFLAIGGAGGSGDVDRLLAAADALPTGAPAHAGVRSQEASFSVPSRADRKLRQSIRITYEQLRRAFENSDSMQTGYISVDVFFNILQKHCMQTSMQDFRYMMRKVSTHPVNTDKYDWRHFLELYNPSNAPHELMGGSTSRVSEPPRSRQSKQDAKHPYRSVPNSASAPDPAATESFPARPSPSPSPSSSGGGGGNSGASALSDMKKVWINILRSCQRADPNKSGFVNRTQFITALEKNLHSNMNAETMARLADSYQRRDGLVDYKSCFRNTLSDLANILPMPTSDSASAFKAPAATTGRPIGAVHPWEFDYIKQEIQHFDDPIIPHWKTACLKPKPGTARARPSTQGGGDSSTPQLSPLRKLPARGPVSLDDGEKFMASYDPKVRETCTKVQAKWRPVWKQLSAGFHDKQVKNHPGNITTDHMLEVFSANDIHLTKNEYGVISRYFRAIGLNDVVNYQDFMRCCSICRQLGSFAATS